MKPDRSNYELWFTDWLDGNLSEDQVEELKLFLKENPDLNEELNMLAPFTLSPPALIFRGKKDLGKTPESLSDSQFEYLCIASLENDLTPGQKSELDEIIRHDKLKRKNFELIQKLKLKPLACSFAGKSSVKKLTTGQKIFRLSAIGLSAAATIAVIISIFLFTPGNNKRGTTQTAQNQTVDTLIIEYRQAIVLKEAEVKVDPESINPAIKNSSRGTSVIDVRVPLAELADQEITDSASLFQRAESIGSLKVPIPENIITVFGPGANAILAFDPGYVPPLIDNRSNVQIFLARFFHERIMNDTRSGTRPVESYEIAQAGIKGLNKLFGWEIALHRNTDENGDIRSYNFSSRLLKFNAPVKKPLKEL